MTDVSSSFTGTGQSASIVPKKGDGPYDAADFNVSLSGTFVGTVQLERKFTASGGSTWHPLTAAGTQIGIWTAPCSEVFEEPQGGVEYRLNCTAYTSGTISYRMGQ
jgi:hypothetical protein